MKLLLLIIFFIFLTLSAKAQISDEVFDQHNLMLAQFQSAAWPNMSDKIRQLNSNFLNRFEGNQLLYLAPKPLKDTCSKRLKKEDQAAKTQFTIIESSSLRHHLKIDFYGCGDSLVLQEEILVEGKDLSPLKLSEYLEGERSFNIQKNETRRFFTYHDGDGNELSRVETLLESQRIFTQVFIFEREFFAIESNMMPMLVGTEGKIKLIVQGFDTSKYKFRGHKMGHQSTSRFEPPNEFTVHVVPKQKRHVYTLKGNNEEELNESDFYSFFNLFIVNGIKSGMGEVFKFLIHWFPKTSSGGGNNAASKKFLEEIDFYLQRVRSGAPNDLRLLEVRLNELRQAVQDNKFIPIDRRDN